MTEAMVETYNLSKYYGKFAALQNLNLRIDRGAIHGFIGPNGAGKTTTMRILATLLEPSGGKAYVAGNEVTARPLDVRRVIGYMPDFFGVYDNMKVWEYLDFFAAAYHVPQARRKGMIDDLLALVDLGAKKESFVEDLSRGMKQRLCLARTLVHEPELLILDEPASGLDPHARIELRELLKELRALGKTILVSSHILSELTEMCTHVAIIEQGKLLINGRVEDILQAMQPSREIYVRVLDRAGEAVAFLESLPGISGLQVMPPGFRAGVGAVSPVATPAPQARTMPPVPTLGAQTPQALPPPPPGAFSQPQTLPGAVVPPGAATIYMRVTGDETFLNSALRGLISRDVPVYGFEEAVGNLEDIFLRTTRGLVQ